MIKNFAGNKNLPIIIFGLFFFILVPNDGWSLPPCPGQYSNTTWTDCVGTKTYVSGSKYEGDWKHGKFDGKGKLFIPNLGIYIGEFKNGQLHGKGIIKFSNGDEYLGQLRFGRAYGRGTYKYGLDSRVILGVTENGTFPYEWEVTERVKTFAESLK